MHSHRAKLDRVDKHLQSLDDAVKGFVESNPYEIVREFDAESGYYILRVKWTADPPIECSLLVGDILFNLKSALDHLIFALSTQSGASIIESDPEFPIYSKPKGFRDNREKRIRHIPSGAQTVVEQLQPYQGADRRPLALLYDLHQRDKHRILHLVATMVQESDAEFISDGEVDCWEMASVRWSRDQPFKDGAEIVRIRPWPDRCPESEMHVKLDLKCEIAFDQPPLKLGFVRYTMRHIRDYVHGEVVPKLEHFLV